MSDVSATDVRPDMAGGAPSASILPEAAKNQTAGVPGRRIYQAGTLRYTFGGLAVLFIWLLWGDFCATMFQNVLGPFLPLYLKSLHASNVLIGVMCGGIGGVLNFFFLPNISMWSDHCRTRWGRRIPFLMVSAPLAGVALILMGFSADFGAWLYAASGWNRYVSATALILGVLFIADVMYALSLMTTNNIYQYLLRDVVPLAVMPRFLMFFRLVGTAAGFLFQWMFFQYVLSWSRLICTSLGLLYLVSFLLICWQVREGRYPPVPPRPRQSLASFFRSQLQSYIVYFHDCLSVPIYRNFVITFGLVTTAQFCANPFLVLFARQTLGMNMARIGAVYAWATLVSGIAYLPAAWVCEKFSSMGLCLLSLLLSAVISLLAFLLIHDSAGWLVYSLLFAIPTVGWAFGSLAVTMFLFPSADFGKYSSSLLVLGFGSVAVTTYAAGLMMDFFGSNYRMIFLWSFACYAVALVPMYGVYRSWKHHGGPANYIPPLPA